MNAITLGDAIAYTYNQDALGRQNRLTVLYGTSSYYTTAAYDAHSGKLTDTRAFSGFLLHYAYNSFGYSQEIDDGTNLAIVYWKPNARDAELHTLQSTTYNGVATNQAFDAKSGHLTQIYAGANNAVANLSFGFDTGGNLDQRGDLNTSWQSETFCYDKLNRLLGSNLGASCTGAGAIAVGYDAAGNIATKSDVGAYSYGSGAGPHALTGVTGTVNNVLNPVFTYDANGSMTGGAGRSASYTASNMTRTVAEGSTRLTVAGHPCLPVTRPSVRHRQGRASGPPCTSPGAGPARRPPSIRRAAARTTPPASSRAIRPASRPADFRGTGGDRRRRS
jgi:hypothetical protein